MQAGESFRLYVESKFFVDMNPKANLFVDEKNGMDDEWLQILHEIRKGDVEPKSKNKNKKMTARRQS